ncbi:MAG: phytoene desaturase [Candidatus Kapabacteria bacterium]|nr:phytoene desaturase [Candidatus Kapabacteria bacterium]
MTHCRSGCFHWPHGNLRSALRRFARPLTCLMPLASDTMCSSTFRLSKPRTDMGRIGVIGGGIGGLVAAIRLAAAGHRVDLFEQGQRLGGKLNRVVLDGSTFETGPTLVTMPFVLDEVFASVGARREEYITLKRVDPACQYRWTDGARLDLPFAPDDVIDAIERFSPGQGQAARRYLEHARKVYELTKDVFIFGSFDGLAELIKRRNLPLLPSLPKLRPFSTLHAHNASYFSDPRLVQLFDRFATYNGSTPFRAPATLMVIPWVEIGFGAWYPQGGMHAIADGLHRLAEEVGVRVHLETGVKKILTRNRRVCGLELRSGERIDADHVVSNADVWVTRHQLLGLPAKPPADPSCSGLVMHISTDRVERGMTQHTILFSDNYRAEFEAIRHSDHPDAGATVYISRSCMADPSLAAEGKENWFVLVNAPANGIGATDGLTEKSAWRGREHERAETVLRRMEAFGLRPHIHAMGVRTPDTMARQWSTDRGSLYGASSNTPWSAFLRPRQRSRDVQNLWYVGGSSHPGGGIPLVATSGMIAANQILTTFSQS